MPSSHGSRPQPTAACPRFGEQKPHVSPEATRLCHIQINDLLHGFTQGMTWQFGAAAADVAEIGDADVRSQ